MIRAKENLEPVPAYQPGKPIEEVLKEYGIESAIKLASNENPHGFSPRVKQAIEKQVHQIFFYPDGQAAQLRSALSHYLQVRESQLIFGAGLDEIIQMISRTFLEKGTNTVMAVPSFPMYKINAMIEGAEAREVPTQNGTLDLDGMLAAIDDKTRIVWVCNPNNPTGTYLPTSEVLRFIEQVPKHVLIVFDEAYYEYVTTTDYPQTIPFLQQFSNLVVLRTFSKAYGLAGLRIGYGIANEDIIASINKVRKPFNTSYLAQIAAIAALEDQDFVKKAVENNQQELEYAYEQLDQLGFTYYLSQTNFIYIDVKQPGVKVYEELLPYGVIIRPMAGHYIRVTMGTHDQNKQFFDALKKVIN